MRLIYKTLPTCGDDLLFKQSVDLKEMILLLVILLQFGTHTRPSLW